MSDGISKLPVRKYGSVDVEYTVSMFSTNKLIEDNDYIIVNPDGISERSKEKLKVIASAAGACFVESTYCDVGNIVATGKAAKLLEEIEG